MVLHHTGSEGELVYCSTPCLSVTIKGAEASPPLVKCDQKEATLKIVCDDDYDVTLSGEAEMAFSQYLGKAYSGEFRSLPIFFEQRRYELIVEPTEGHTVEFWHENYHVRNKVSRVGRAGKLLSGVINFGNDIGFSDLVFLVDGHQYLKITIEVFPSKISYKKDYLAIVADVTKEVYNLVFDFLRKTYASFDVSSSRQSSPVEFFTIIRKIYDEYTAAADMVLRSPHHLLQQESEVLPQHKIRRYDGKTSRWLEKHPGQIVRGEKGFLVEKALAVRKYVTYDTRENRLTKNMLEQTARRLEQFKKQYERISQNIDPAVLDRIRGMIAGIQRRCNTGFMKDVASEPSGAGMSLVFGMAPGYRQLYRCYLLLQHGLAVTGSVFNISVKDLAVLYEYWCFIKLNSLMKDKYELVSQDIIRTNGTGLSVSLIKGQSSRVKYRDLKTGEVITLSYNPKEVNVPTVTQRPDNVLRLEKKGAETDYEYVFDAKATGEAYEGTWVSGSMTGIGEMNWPGLGTYKGNFVDNKRQGSGVFIWTYEGEPAAGSPVSYDGEWDDDKIGNYGTLVIAGFGTYTGNFSKQKRSGMGKFTWNNGDVYEGAWSADAITGDGTLTISDGTELKGNFQSGKLNSGTVTYSVADGIAVRKVTAGKAQADVKVTYSDGTILEGKTKGKEFTGNVTITYSSGDKYVGAIKNGLKNGKGTYTWRSGAHYIGEWAGDLMHGKGKYYYNTSEKDTYLTGTFINGKPSGTLVYVAENKLKYQTIWKNGECTSITYKR